MTKSILPILFASCLLLASSNISAEEQERSYGTKVGHKALNGVANIFTSFLEIPKSIINTTNESNIVYGVLGGSIKGAVNTFGRFINGVSDLATAPLPTKQVVQPAYIWDDFDLTTTYGDVFRLDRQKTIIEETVYSEEY